MYKLYAFRTQMTNGDNESRSVPCLSITLTRPDSDGAYVEVCKPWYQIDLVDASKKVFQGHN